jgi:hypothetical protein
MFVPIVVAVVSTLIAVGLVIVVAQSLRRWSLHKRFGSEFDRLAGTDGRRAAEFELLAREHRYQQLDLRDLTKKEREAYQRAWTDAQSSFADDPGSAVTSADELVSRLSADLGYATDDLRDQLAQLSVGHARALGRYRTASEIYARYLRDGASTEDLRRAFIDYRELFADLLDDEPVLPTPDGRTRTESAKTRTESAASPDRVAIPAQGAAA